MPQPERLPLPKIIAYGIGIFGWSLSINIVSVLLAYIYLPPTGKGLVNLVPQFTVMVVFNIISLIMPAGRLFDAVVDPLIAAFSDRSRNPKGRRVPLMRIATLPMVVFAILMFIPPHRYESNMNIVWLGFIQLGYYFFFGLYVIPYNALLSELGHYPNGKMHLSTAQSVGYMIGMVVGSFTALYATQIQDFAHIADRLTAYQYAIGAENILGGLCMLLPAFVIDERRYCKPGISSEPFMQSLKTALGNPNFRIFAFADATFFMSIAIISAGLQYYVTVLLGISEDEGGKLMALVVVVTLCFYPVVNWAEQKVRKKKLIIMAFVAQGFVFTGIYFFGRMPVSPYLQAIALMVLFGIFDSFLGILPTTVVGDIAEADAKATGQNKEGMYFGMRALFQKTGQTLGIMIFLMLTLYGKDPGHDMGLRLNGIIGSVLLFLAAAAYSRYKD
ncbi:MAG TPA: MFS transporter [Chitinophagales bacterium]|nr:MFS transporter [Chitinophagales bacterium]